MGVVEEYRYKKQLLNMYSKDVLKGDSSKVELVASLGKECEELLEHILDSYYLKKN
jgi:hypothetical protein